MKTVKVMLALVFVQAALCLGYLWFDRDRFREPSGASFAHAQADGREFPPLEFERRGAHGACAGSGALLPFTMPKTARAIARDRIAEHERLGGGAIVTGCATSLRWLRAQRAPVQDLVTVMARSLSGG